MLNKKLSILVLLVSQLALASASGGAPGIGDFFAGFFGRRGGDGDEPNRKRPRELANAQVAPDPGDPLLALREQLRVMREGVDNRLATRQAQARRAHAHYHRYHEAIGTLHDSGRREADALLAEADAIVNRLIAALPRVDNDGDDDENPQNPIIAITALEGLSRTVRDMRAATDGLAAQQARLAQAQIYYDAYQNNRQGPDQGAAALLTEARQIVKNTPAPTKPTTRPHVLKKANSDDDEE